MKKRSMSLFSAAFVFCILMSGNANAFFPLPTIDFSAIVQGIKTAIEQVKSSSTIVTTTQTISKISSTIGDEIATVQKFIGDRKSEIEANLKELEKAKKLAESYKKEFDEYKKYAEDKIEMAKKAKANAEKLKELMENKDALLGTVKGKVSSVAKNYTGGLDVPTSMEELDAIKGNITSKAETAGLKIGDKAQNVGLPAEGLSAGTPGVEGREFQGAQEYEDAYDDEYEFEEDMLYEDGAAAGLRGSAERALDAPALGGRIGEKADLKAKETIRGAESSLKAEGKFRDKGAAFKADKAALKADKAIGKASGLKADKAALKADVAGKVSAVKSDAKALTVDKDPASLSKAAEKASSLKADVKAQAAEKASAVKSDAKALKVDKAPASLSKAIEKASSVKFDKPALKAPAAEKKAPAAVEKAPAKNLLKKTSSIETESFFSKREYNWSFASAGPDGETAKTGKATSMDAIVPRDVASFCELSVADLKDDTEKILDCIKKINQPQDGSNTDTDNMAASPRQVLNMRKQNASESLAIAMKMENIGANQEKVLSDLDKKAENLSQGRQISSMAPHYSMEIAKALKNYAFVRATHITFEVFDDMEQLEFEK